MQVMCMVGKYRKISYPKWIQDISEFDESFIKSYDEEIDEGYFLEFHVQYPKSLDKFHNDSHFFLKR